MSTTMYIFYFRLNANYKIQYYFYLSKKVDFLLCRRVMPEAIALRDPKLPSGHARVRFLFPHGLPLYTYTQIHTYL